MTDVFIQGLAFIIFLAKIAIIFYWIKYLIKFAIDYFFISLSDFKKHFKQED